MKDKRNIILVTGGAGYVGAVLVQKLVRKGFLVRVFDTLYFGEEPLKKVKNKIEIVKGDIRNIPDELFKNVKSIIHLAGLSNDPTANFNPVANFAINTKATIDLAKKAKSNGVSKFIFGSSASIYDQGKNKEIRLKNEKSRVSPKAPYALSKLKAEQEILKLADDNFSVTIFRKGTIFGFSPRMRYDLVINMMVKNSLQYGEIKIFNKGLQWRPLVNINDVADAYITVLTSKSKKINKEIFNLSSDNFRVIDLAVLIKHTVEKHYKKSIKIVYDEGDKNDRSYSIDNGKIKKILKFKPKVSIKKAAIDLILKIEKYKLTDYDNTIYYNINHMKPILELE